MQSIKARENFEGEFTLPGDKSVTHRAVMLNGGAEGEATVTNALMGEDCVSTCRCMRSLGAEIDVDGTTLRVKGTPRFRRGAELNCGNSGTTIRLLTGFVAGKGIDAKLYGDNSLSARPMNRVAEPLSRLNADVRTTDGHAPVYVYPSTLSGADVELKIASAQVKSAVLLAGISAEGETRVSEPVKSRDHTERMLAAMGADIRVDGNAVTVRKSELKAVDVCVPSDISSAAYFMALGALKGKTLCKNVGINPTRTGILTAFNRLGVKYTLLNKRISGGEETYRTDCGGRTRDDRRTAARGVALRVRGGREPYHGRERIARQGKRPRPHDDGAYQKYRRRLRGTARRVRDPRQEETRRRRRQQLSRSQDRDDGGGGTDRLRAGREYQRPRMLRDLFPRFLR